MKLVTKSNDPNALYETKEFLELNGIPAMLSDENITNKGMSYAKGESGLWVYLDEQFDEALKLVSDPSYQVVNKVDVDVFYATANLNKKKTHKKLIQLATLGIVILLVLFIVLKVI